MAHAGGRPPKFKNLKQMQLVIDAYFLACDPHWEDEEYWDWPWLDKEELEPQLHGGALMRRRKHDYDADMVLMTRKRLTVQDPYTMAGLARRLGLSRQGLMEYKGKDEFSDAIMQARAQVEEYNERILLNGKNPSGAIFNLKVNFGYRENIEENPPPENPIVFINNVPITPDEFDEEA